jgi:hypothetical protein
MRMYDCEKSERSLIPSTTYLASVDNVRGSNTSKLADHSHRES